MHQKKAILSIAGFDPSGGAGILMDAAVFRAMGFHPLTILTSVAAQGSSGVSEVRPLSGSFIRKELEIIFGEFRPAALKIGMVYTASAVRTISSFLGEIKITAVLDPLIRASSGGDLIEPAALPLLEKHLVPLCQLVTPNLSEACRFLGREIRSSSQAEQATLELSKRWNCAVLLKGGHLPGDPVDVLAAEGSCVKFPHRRMSPGMNLRGTGCALSAAVAAGLADEMDLKKAVEAGIRFVEEAVKGAYVADPGSDVGFLSLA